MEKIAIKGDYLLKLIRDDDPMNPRAECDNFGKMVCFHRRYSLGDEHSYPNKDEFLFDLLTDTFGCSDKAERFLCSAERKAEDGQHRHGGFDRAVDNMLLEKISEKHVVLPLFLFDHGGITMNTTGFSCPFDSGQVGWVYATKEKVQEEYGGKHLTKNKREKAEALMRAEVECYDHYLCGEVYGFELYENGEATESCWGFMGDMADVIDDIKFCLPEEHADMVELLQDPPRRQSVGMLMAWAREQAQQMPSKSGKALEQAAAR